VQTPLPSPIDTRQAGGVPSRALDVGRGFIPMKSEIWGDFRPRPRVRAGGVDSVTEAVGYPHFRTARSVSSAGAINRGQAHRRSLLHENAP